MKCKESLQKKITSVQFINKQVEDLMSETPDGSTQDIESKLKALELDFDLDSKIKLIEDNLVSKRMERDRKITEMKNFLQASAQSFNSKLKISANGSQKPVADQAKDNKDFKKPEN